MTFSMLSLFECITRFSSLSIEEIKLFAIVNWIFHVSDFLRLFIMSFKYILQRIVFYLYRRYFHIQYNCCSKNYLLLLVYDNFLLLLHAQKDSLYLYLSKNASYVFDYFFFFRPSISYHYSHEKNTYFLKTKIYYTSSKSIEKYYLQGNHSLSNAKILWTL